MSTLNLTPEPEQEKIVGDNHELISQAKSGANWFYWIAGLSVVNSLIYLSGADWAFFAGLAITQIIEGFFQAIAEETGISAFHFFGVMLDMAVAAVFVMFGYFARRGAKWAFLLGMILYGLDGIIYLLFGSFIAVAIHAFALYSLFNGFQSSRD